MEVWSEMKRTIEMTNTHSFPVIVLHADTRKVPTLKPVVTYGIHSDQLNKQEL